MTTKPHAIQVPRYPIRRRFVQFLGRIAIRLICDFKVTGIENVPEDEAILFVCNHFNYADPAPAIITLPWYTEYIAGTERPQAPPLLKMLPELWTVCKVRRGTGSRDAFTAAKAILDQGGKLVIFIEGGAWADVLRPPRPGASFMAVNSDCRVIPVALMGVETLFNLFRTGRRGKITMDIGQPYGPLTVSGRGRERREQLNEHSEAMMQKLVEMLPPEKHGVYSDDPVLRAEAEKVAAFPWD